MTLRIVDYLVGHGYRATVTGAHRLQALREELQDRCDSALVDKDVYESYLSGFDEQPPAEVPDARSLIVVACADPPVRFSFNWRGRTFRLVVPPTYLNAEAKDAAAGTILGRLLAAEGYRLARVAVPKKLLAVRSGLARYGRNNIAYVEGLGSYHRLVVFCSDCPCDGDRWIEARMLDRCETCRACLDSCPPAAIAGDRFLLHAERCLTFWNEKPPEIAFPDWVEEAWHNCLVGCLECQRVCPENRMHIDRYTDGAGFSEGETELLLEGVDPSQLPAALTQKLQRWDLFELYEQLPRNLPVELEMVVRLKA